MYKKVGVSRKNTNSPAQLYLITKMDPYLNIRGFFPITVCQVPFASEQVHIKRVMASDKNSAITVVDFDIEILNREGGV